MQKFKIKVKRKNGNIRIVAVYLDDKTANLLKQTGDPKLLEAYLLEEYRESRRERQEEYWNTSLDEDMENGIDYEDEHTYGDFTFDDFEDENLRAAIEQLTARQQEILRLVYIEGKSQKEIAQIYGVKKQAISNAIGRIYERLKRILEKK